MDLGRVIQQVHQRLLVTKQLHALRPGREDFTVHGSGWSYLSDDQVDRSKQVIGPIIVAVGAIRLQAEIEGVLESSDAVWIIIIELVGIDIIERGQLPTLVGKMVHIVISRATRQIAVAVMNRLPAVAGRFDAANVAHPVGVGAK